VLALKKKLFRMIVEGKGLSLAWLICKVVQLDIISQTSWAQLSDTIQFYILKGYTTL
jgi:hypothetical protein